LFLLLYLLYSSFSILLPYMPSCPSTLLLLFTHSPSHSSSFIFLSAPLRAQGVKELHCQYLITRDKYEPQYICLLPLAACVVVFVYKGD
jgi:hypothetical protein